jgi:Domain of unknown function (DUF6766)
MRTRQWLTNHSLSLSFGTLFLASLAGQSLSGLWNYNSELAMHGLPAVSYLSYLHTGNFLDGIFTNWQAALLQLGCLIVFASQFRERGAAHSRSPIVRADRRTRIERSRRSWVYRHSLSLAFAALFVLSFLGHLFFGVMDHNEKLQMIRKPPITTISYGLSSEFWFTTTQTWEAEFAALVFYILLSVYLRQQGSPESKPVDSSNRATGVTNR